MTFTTTGEGVEYWQYRYDLLNRLVEVKKNGTIVAEYGYSPDGLRQVRVANGVTTHYVFEGTEPIFVKNVNQNKRKSYVFAGTKLIARVDGVIGDPNAKKYFYHCDQVGSVKVVTNDVGTPVWKADYFSFGQQFGKSKLDPKFEEDDLGFTGKGYDADIGLYYFNARWYDADTGRFISEDPVADTNNPNLYSGFANNPLRYTDPTGLAIVGGVYNTQTGEYNENGIDESQGGGDTNYPLDPKYINAPGGGGYKYGCAGSYNDPKTGAQIWVWTFLPNDCSDIDHLKALIIEYYQLQGESDRLIQQVSIEITSSLDPSFKRDPMLATKLFTCWEQLNNVTKEITDLGGILPFKNATYKDNPRIILPIRADSLAKITSYFGVRWGDKHTGIDIGGYGLEVLSPGDGTVVWAGRHYNWNSTDPDRGFGLTVIIDCGINPNTGNNVIVILQHNSKILVNKGDKVTRGTVVAISGHTGYTVPEGMKGSHIHYTLMEVPSGVQWYTNDRNGIMHPDRKGFAIDPLTYEWWY